jgi:ribosome maturation factor RimP
MSDHTVLDRVRALVLPIVADLGLELYDCEFAGGTLRVVVDTPPGSPGGVDLEQLSLITRLTSRELDHHDPVPGRYTLEVSSPGLERSLKRAEHFQREVGKVVSLRLHAPLDGRRRLEGPLLSADDRHIVVHTDSGDVQVALDQIERARTVFVWGPTPKPGGRSSGRQTTPSTSPTEASR